MNEFDLFFGISLGINVFLIALVAVVYLIRKKIKRIIFLFVWNMLLCTCLISLVFIFGESYYRFFYDTTDSFSINKVSQRWVKRHYQFNNRNLRDNVDYELRIAPGKRRITILGDSFMAGHGIKEVNDRVGNKLREKYPNTEVHLIAINGANSTTELNRLIGLQRAGYELDLVILAYCLNDIDPLVQEADGIYKRIHAFSSNLNFIQQQSYFINMLSFRWFAFNNPDYLNYASFVLNAYHQEAWEKQKEILRQMKNLVHYANARFVVMTYPFLQKKQKEYAYKEVHQLIDEFWEKEQVPHLDLLNTYEPYLGEQLKVNKYDAHPNEFANQLAVEAVSQFLKQKVRSTKE